MISKFKDKQAGLISSIFKSLREKKILKDYTESNLQVIKNQINLFFKTILIGILLKEI